MTSELGPCPRCGKRRGQTPGHRRGRFRHYAICGACQWMTAISRTEGIAAKLWNEAKPNNDQVTRESETAGATGTG